MTDGKRDIDWSAFNPQGTPSPQKPGTINWGALDAAPVEKKPLPTLKQIDWSMFPHEPPSDQKGFLEAEWEKLPEPIRRQLQIIGEIPAAVGTGFGAFPISTLYRTYERLIKGKSPEEAKKLSEELAAKITYVPKTEAAKGVTQAAFAPFEQVMTPMVTKMSETLSFQFGGNKNDWENVVLFGMVAAPMVKAAFKPIKYSIALGKEIKGRQLKRAVKEAGAPKEVMDTVANIPDESTVTQLAKDILTEVKDTPAIPKWEPGSVYTREGVTYTVLKEFEKGRGRHRSTYYEVRNEKSGDVATLRPEDMQDIFGTEEPVSPEGPTMGKKTLTSKEAKGKVTFDNVVKLVEKRYGLKPGEARDSTTSLFESDFRGIKKEPKTMGQVESRLIDLEEKGELSFEKKPTEPLGPTKPTPPKIKQPWEMTRSEVIQREQSIHKDIQSVTDKGIRFTDGKWLPFKDKRGTEKITFLWKHRLAVEQALKEGKSVPPEVLAEYPDLKPAGVVTKPTPPTEKLGLIVEERLAAGPEGHGAVTGMKHDIKNRKVYKTYEDGAVLEFDFNENFIRVVGEEAEAGPALSFQIAEPEPFVESIQKMKAERPKLAESLSWYTPEEYAQKGTKLFLSEDGRSGYGLNPDGELISVFSLERGRGPAIVEEAVRNGATYLDCIGDYLRDIYEEFGGFKTWKQEPNWTAGEPDVYFMRREVTSAKETATKGPGGTGEAGEGGGILPETQEVPGQTMGVPGVHGVRGGREAGGLGTPEGEVPAGGLQFDPTNPQFIPDKILGRPLGEINTTYEIKHTLLQYVEMMRQKITEMKDKARSTWADDERVAQELGITYEELSQLDKNMPFHRLYVEAAQAMAPTFAQEAFRLKKLYDQTGNDVLLARAHQRGIQAAEMFAYADLGFSEFGRALNLGKKAVTPGKINYAAMKKLFKELGKEGVIKHLDDLAKIDLTNPAEVKKFIREYAKASKADKFFEIWMNALLSSPKTHFVNIASNTITMLSKPLETAIAATIELHRPLFGKTRRVYFGEAGAEVVGMWHGFIHGIRNALHAFVNETTVGDVSKMELSHIPAWKGKTGKAIRTPGRLLLAADEAFKAVVWTSDVYGGAWRLAKRGKGTGATFGERFASLVENPPEWLKQRATGEALYRTFQKRLGKAGNMISAMRQTIYPLRFIAPFVRTPINIAKFGLERTPVNFARIAYMASKGKLKGRALPLELAKAGLGTASAIGAFMLALDGVITGGGPKDRAKRDQLYRQGWLPYAVKIGGRYYQFGRLEPFGMVLGLSGDFAELIRYMNEGEKDLIAGKLILAWTQNLSNKTFLRGASDFFNAYTDPERYGPRWIQSITGTVIPSVVAEAARGTDDTIRDARNLIDNVKARIPIISRSVPPKRELFGETIKRKGPGWARFLSPIMVSAEETDIIETELENLNIAIGMPTRTIMGVELTPAEYSEFAELAGKLAYTVLKEELLSSEWYWNLNNNDKEDAIMQRIRKARKLAREFYMLQLVEKRKKKK